MKFTIAEIEDAYRKLKSYVYYDNSSLFLRRQLSEFECDDLFEKKLTDLRKALVSNRPNMRETYFSTLMEKIDYKILPKNFNSTLKHDDYVITNSVEENSYEVDSINFFIDAPVEIHIISVLWILKIGILLNNDVEKYLYGNKIDRNNENKVSTGLKVFRTYYSEYQKWRDNGIKKTKELLKEKKNAVLVTLDIKNYYHSVRLKFDTIEKELGYNEDFIHYRQLNNLLKKTHMKYTEKIIDKKSYSKEETILPIGLLSSGILANFYLKEFDYKIIENLNPAYYGRYVDDILIVVANPVKKTIDDFMKHYFKEQAKAIDQRKENKEYFLLNYKKLTIQKEKVKLYFFDVNFSQALLNNFEKTIRKNSSEFRFLPDEDAVDLEFQNQAYNIIYSDSTNKIRSIEDFRYDKYGAAKYLANKIFSSKFWRLNKKDTDQTVNQIFSFFKGNIALKYFSLWEKIFTYCIINKLENESMEFYKYIQKDIQKINIKKEFDFLKDDVNKILLDKLKESLKEFLGIAISLPLSLNLEFFSVQNKCPCEMRKILDNYQEFARSFRKANMLRHTYVFYPLINYFASDKINLINKGIADFSNFKEKLCLNKFNDIKKTDRNIKYSPRFIHFHEVVIYYVFFIINEGKTSFFTEGGNKDYLIKAFKLFYMLNYGWNSHERSFYCYKQLRKKYLDLDNCYYNKLNNTYPISWTQIRGQSEGGEPFDQLKVAIVSMTTKTSDINDSLLGHPNLGEKRLKDLFSILNSVISENANVIVLPELSIPYAWLNILSAFAMKNEKVIVCGLEHWVDRSLCVHNLMVTIIPNQIGGYKSAIIRIRLKNHYSPEEKRVILGYGLTIPNTSLSKYDLFIWNNIYFSCYNCFELADIVDRSLFKSKVDLLIGVERNRDINYFSNIVESACRDVHCYFVQVNSAEYGDSRITKPSATYSKDILKLKGGDNIAVLTGTIDIKTLREFQIKEYELQKDDKTYKPTPPKYEKEFVYRRINGENIFDKVNRVQLSSQK